MLLGFCFRKQLIYFLRKILICFANEFIRNGINLVFKRHMDLMRRCHIAERICELFFSRCIRNSLSVHGKRIYHFPLSGSDSIRLVSAIFNFFFPVIRDCSSFTGTSRDRRVEIRIDLVGDFIPHCFPCGSQSVHGDGLSRTIVRGSPIQTMPGEGISRPKKIIGTVA